MASHKQLIHLHTHLCPCRPTMITLTAAFGAFHITCSPFISEWSVDDSRAPIRGMPWSREFHSSAFESVHCCRVPAYRKPHRAPVARYLSRVITWYLPHHQSLGPVAQYKTQLLQSSLLILRRFGLLVSPPASRAPITVASEYCHSVHAFNFILGDALMGRVHIDHDQTFSISARIYTPCVAPRQTPTVERLHSW